NVRWVRGSGSATLAGTARPRMTLQEWMRALERKDHAWASRVDLSLLLDMKSFDLNTLAPIDTSLSSLRGIAPGTVRVTGTAGAPGGDGLPSPQGRNSKSRGPRRSAGGPRGGRFVRRASGQRHPHRGSGGKEGSPDRNRMVAIGGEEAVRRFRVSPARDGIHGNRPGNLHVPIQRRLQSRSEEHTSELQ